MIHAGRIMIQDGLGGTSHESSCDGRVTLMFYDDLLLRSLFMVSVNRNSGLVTRLGSRFESRFTAGFAEFATTSHRGWMKKRHLEESTKALAMLETTLEMTTTLFSLS